MHRYLQPKPKDVAYYATASTTAPPTIIPTNQKHAPHVFPAPPVPGTSLATLAVAPAVTRLQLAVPQPYPLGQQPALSPPSLPHRNHPVAHVPVVDAGTPDAGTTTVTPSVSTMVVDATGGQDVVWQSRPVWQQPPPWVARQA